jgi:hypothetical protein
MKEKKVLRFEVYEPKLRSRESFLDGSCAIKTPDPFFVVRLVSEHTDFILLNKRTAFAPHE